MDQFNADSDVIEVVKGGQKYTVRFPTMKEARAFQKRLKDSSSEDADTILIEIFAALGLAKEVSEGMTMAKLMKLWSVVMGAEQIKN